MANLTNLKKGIDILFKYKPKAEIDCQHDIICVQVDEDAVSPEDKKFLDEAGWHYSDEYESWARFT